MYRRTKLKIYRFYLDTNDEFEFYFNEEIAGATDDKFDTHTHKISKFLFYHFNDLRRDLGEEPNQIKHTIVSDNQHALELLQGKDWPYFINRLLVRIKIT